MTSFVLEKHLLNTAHADQLPRQVLHYC